MAVSKVVYGGEVLIDITDSSVTASKLVSGYSAYNKAGEKVNGSLDLSGTTATASTVRSGYKFLNSSGTLTTGTYNPTTSAVTVTSTSGYTINTCNARNIGDQYIVAFKVTKGSNWANGNSIIRIKVSGKTTYSVQSTMAGTGTFSTNTSDGVLCTATASAPSVFVGCICFTAT